MWASYKSNANERVRDTLAHELCHAAVRLINGVKESHGPVWRSWAQKVNRAFPFMPVIARCHDYVIATKYTYQCTKCNYRIGRHSKSLDTDKKVCGHCLGKFEVYLTRDLNSSEGARTPATPRTPRTPNKFALFVKESYAEVKKKDNSLKHADVMKILSQQFSEKNKISE
ncbi:acidic repeat-containing protein [Elysia marginata]|uniref:Acidic repeat-containing protein n=1 Tax=Elysia marginata TaxID=1093978 RepID=A0AAV4IE43_9GAST|nr:acidic repeat-containing protein [Elysia marginata]